ncbi:hypothetical protein EMPS_08328 [Entomortierella parvispora]|uniref:Epoxide hydrolase n=1 Tax=Entomortierella parvispora TaxID=205924 RepID=A0A9P3LZH8_9FUNG|nr:hypothetical protein EMPS_08328 [Entomortierella parvispora]
MSLAISKKGSTPPGPYKAVFFDIGGVVVGSPFQGIAEFEREHNLPPNYLNVAISRSGPKGAFQRLERGEIDLWEFYGAFSEQLSNPLNVSAYSKYAEMRGKTFDRASFKAPKVDGRALFHQMMGKAAIVNQSMVQAIALLADAGYTVVALTNNFHYPSDERGRQEQELILQVTAKTLAASSDPQSPASSSGPLVMGQDQLKTIFHHFLESAIMGLRKPDPAIYKKACEVVGVEPSQVVFLDDIGANLKSAQDVGYKTIRVELGKPEKAIKELEQILGNGIKLTPAPKL